MSFESSDPCVACRFYDDGSVCFHHLKSQKSHPEHKEKGWNKISVCLICHNNFHAKGTSFMAEKYRGVENWLIENGWEYCTLTNKWRHENDRSR